MSPASNSAPPVVCPVCASQDVRWLKDTSKDADVDYYRCNECGHVWWVQKGDETQTAHEVPPKR